MHRIVTRIKQKVFIPTVHIHMYMYMMRVKYIHYLKGFQFFIMYNRCFIDVCETHHKCADDYKIGLLQS